MISYNLRREKLPYITFNAATYEINCAFVCFSCRCWDVRLVIDSSNAKSLFVVKALMYHSNSSFTANQKHVTVLTDKVIAVYPVFILKISQFKVKIQS